MKVLITGAAGLLGQEVWKSFEPAHDCWATDRIALPLVPPSRWKDCDLTDLAATYEVVTRLNPDLVIHCAAYNDVDKAESEPEQAFRVNALGTRNLALACQRFDTVLLALSTDYVFDGIQAPKEGYREFDPTHPLGVYGQSKLWGEVFVRQLLNKFYIVRTSTLFGEGRPTFVDAVLGHALAGKTTPCVSDMVASPTYAVDLAQALRQLAESGHYGVYHLTNAGFCSRVELAQEVLRIHHQSTATLRLMTQAEFKLPARRPVFSGLQNLAWQLDGLRPLRPWQEALRAHFQAARLISR